MTVHNPDTQNLQDVPDGRRGRRILAYHPSVRRRVEVLTSTSSAIEDLADTFPALLLALATDHGTAARRQQCLRLVLDGAPLRQAAEAAGIAWWARRLPAQAFSEPLLTLPDDAVFSERIVGFLPSSPEHAKTWLWMVSYGAQACNNDFALWAAAKASRNHLMYDSDIGKDHFRYLAAWAWHAANPTSPGFALLRRPWTPQLGLRRAGDELTVWRRRLRLALCIGEGDGTAWLADGTALGYAFVGLRTTADFIAESEAMDNCLDQFADRLEAGRSHVFSVRKNGRPVADLELVAADLGVGMPTVCQLRGLRNRGAQPDIWRATYAWLGSQPLRPLQPCPSDRTSSDLRRAARAFWKPYLGAISGGIAAEFAATISADLGFRMDAKPARRHTPRS